MFLTMIWIWLTKHYFILGSDLYSKANNCKQIVYLNSLLNDKIVYKGDDSNCNRSNTNCRSKINK